MAHPPMVDSYLRELLAELDVEVEATDLGYELAGEPRIRLAVVGTGRALRVLGVALVADQVEASSALLEHINEVNAALPFGRLFWQRGEVLVEESVLGGALTAALLDHQLAFLRWAARSQDEELGLTPAQDDSSAVDSTTTTGSGARLAGRTSPDTATSSPDDPAEGRTCSERDLADTPVAVAASASQPIANAAGYL